MKPNLALVAVLASSVSLAACGKRDASNAAPAVAAMAAAVDAKASPPATDAAASPAPVARALRITIDTQVVVSDLDAAVEKLRRATVESGGYVGEAHLSGNPDSRSGALELHIPASLVPAFRARVGQLGEVVSENEKAEDVTEQRADVAARLANARAGEKRLLNLLSDKTGSLADVVAVEKEIAAVRETIERMDAQQRVLEGQISFATVRVQLSTRANEATLGPAARIALAARGGIDTAGSFVVGLAMVAGAAGPTFLIVAAMAYGAYRLVRAARRRRTARLTAA